MMKFITLSITCTAAVLLVTPATITCIDTMDLRAKRYDNLHFSKGAKLELGQRMAKVWLEWGRK